MKRIILILAVLCVWSISCEKNTQIRQYTEITIEAPATMPFSGPMGMDNPHANQLIENSAPSLDLRWKTPANWVEQKGNGMRLASFTSQEADSVTCTIIALGGGAGGLEANILRWAKQINMSDLTSQQIQEFIKKQKSLTSDGKFDTIIFDFTQLQSAANAATPSMMASIFDINGQSVFIKMTGTKAAIDSNRSQFIDLCQSIKLDE